MSIQNSLLAGLAGAAVASSVWYFAGSTDATSDKIANNLNDSGEKMNLAAPAPVPCPQQNSHAIDWLTARKLVRQYIDPDNSHQMIGANGQVLKGWYIDKCIIQNLFEAYPNADGLQVYLGLDSLPNKMSYNRLVWMATQVTVDPVTGQKERENCNSIANTVMDFTEPCPLDCPSKNDLP